MTTFNIGDKVTYLINPKKRDSALGNAVVSCLSHNPKKVYIVTETEGTLFVPVNELEKV